MTLVTCWINIEVRKKAALLLTVHNSIGTLAGSRLAALAVVAAVAAAAAFQIQKTRFFFFGKSERFIGVSTASRPRSFEISTDRSHKIYFKNP
jgi:hypothetical protein